MLEKFTDNKLSQMLSGQKCSSDKTGLGFVVTTSDVSKIASSSKTVFLKPKIEEPQNACMDKGKGNVGDETKVHIEPIKKPPSKRSLPTCHHCAINNHIRPHCPQLRAQKPKVKKQEPKKVKTQE